MKKRFCPRVRVNGRLVPVCHTLAHLAEFDADALSPEPNQFVGPETIGMRAIKRYARSRLSWPHPWDAPKRISLTCFLALTGSVTDLLVCGVITPKLARELCDSIARRFRGK